MSTPKMAPHQWRKAMSRASLPKEGCFRVDHPSTTWVEIPCVSPPNTPYIPATGGARLAGVGPQTVGNGNDFSARVSGTIAWAEGSFPSVTGVTSGSSNNFSLQINSNAFTGASLCSGAKTPSSCQGWEQFVYAPSSAFIQYWLLNYANTCPSGWNTYSNHCWRNSPGSVAVPTVSATNLANVALIGTAGSGGDSIAMSVGSTMYSYGTSSSIVNLNTHWTTAEFNIFGNGGGSQYNFNSNSTLVVQTITDSVTPTTSAPACSSSGTTGETNNLTLVGGSCCPVSGNLPAIQFTESNASPLPGAQTCPLLPVNANWSLVGHPFDAVATGTDGGGKTLYSCRASYQGGLHPGKTRTDWSNCHISYSGQEIQIQAYESLVAAWTDAANGTIPSNALAFGNDGSGGPTLYPCRAYVNGNAFQLGKTRSGLGACNIPYGGAELVQTRYQVLTNALPLSVQAVSSAAPPATALVGGYDSDGAPLYVCQAMYNGGLVPGKTRSNWTNCDVSWGGGEHHVSSYNVLIPTFKTPGTVFQAGNEANGSSLGVCRASYASTTQVGKYLTSSSRCNFPYGGSEISMTSGYQVLAF
jgi:hypothetical protein